MIKPEKPTDQELLKICKNEGCVFAISEPTGELSCSKNQDPQIINTREGCDQAGIRNKEKIGSFGEVRSGNMNTGGFRYDLLPGYTPLNAK